jgi:hypothetical protein
MRAEIPGADELLTLSPAKHQGLLEHHGRLNEAVARFVAGCASAGRPTTAAAAADSPWGT